MGGFFVRRREDEDRAWHLSRRNAQSEMLQLDGKIQPLRFQVQMFDPLKGG